MKILFITPRYHTNLYHRIKALIDLGGHDVSLISLYQGKSECHNLIKPIIIGYSPLYRAGQKIISCFKKNHLKSFWELKLAFPSLKELANHFKKIDPDLVVLKDFQSLNELISLYWAKKKGLKTIALIQTKKDRLLGSKFLFKKYLSLLNFLQVVHFVSPTIRGKEVLTSHGVTCATYLPFVFPVKHPERTYFKDNKINLLSVIKFVQRKDPLTLLKAIKKLKENYSDIRLTLIGEQVDNEYIKEITDYIDQNNLNDIVQIKFDLDYQTIQETYQNFDLFILPSYDEPAAYSIVEAMTNSLPVICSDQCGTKCYVNQGKNGNVFRAKDDQDLADKIKKIIQNKNNLISMGKVSLELAKKNHSAEKFNQEFNMIIEKYNLDKNNA